jgi:hypothetical protein
MKPSDKIYFDYRGKEYCLEGQSYFWVNAAPIPYKKKGWVQVYFVECERVEAYKKDNKPFVVRNDALGPLSQNEWKRIIRLGLLKFIPDAKNRHIKRYFIK